jgi:hypothetical protein
MKAESYANPTSPKVHMIGITAVGAVVISVHTRRGWDNEIKPLGIMMVYGR